MEANCTRLSKRGENKKVLKRKKKERKNKKTLRGPVFQMGFLVVKDQKRKKKEDENKYMKIGEK